MIRSYYGGLVGSQKKLILEDFNYGLASVLVASRNFEPYRIKHTDSLIIHSFPLNIFDFNRFLIAPCVYLIYNSADLVKSLAYVHSLCPNDDLLQYAANNIKHSGSSNASKLLQRMSRSIQEKKVLVEGPIHIQSII